jgi:hypothetical protein
MEPASKILPKQNLRSINTSSVNPRELYPNIIQNNTIAGTCLSDNKRYSVVPILTKGPMGLDKTVPEPKVKGFLSDDPDFAEVVPGNFAKYDLAYIQLKQLMLQNIDTSMDMGFGNIKTKQDIKNVLKRSDPLNLLTIVDNKKGNIVAFIMLQNVENLEAINFGSYLQGYTKGRGDLFVNVFLKEKGLRGCCYKLIFDYMLNNSFLEYNLFVNILLKPKKNLTPDVENGNTFTTYEDHLCFEKYGFRFIKTLPAYKRNDTKYYARLAYRPAFVTLSFNAFGGTESIRNFLGIKEEIFYGVKNPFNDFVSNTGAFLLLSKEDTRTELLEKGSVLCGWWQQSDLSWKYGTKALREDIYKNYNVV